MNETGNYKLKKPLGADVPDIEIINENMDIIDQKLKESIDQVELGDTITE